MIVMMAGLPGAGKSSLAGALAERLPAAVLDKDRIRATLFEPGYVEYSQEQDDFCLEIMLQTAGYLLAKDGGRHVILDGRTFSRRYQRERVFEFCRTAGAKFAILECMCSERTAIGRLALAMAGGRIRPRIGRRNFTNASGICGSRSTRRSLSSTLTPQLNHVFSARWSISGPGAGLAEGDRSLAVAAQ